jgi:hypothetical protein
VFVVVLIRHFLFEDFVLEDLVLRIPGSTERGLARYPGRRLGDFVGESVARHEVCTPELCRQCDGLQFCAQRAARNCPI